MFVLSHLVRNLDTLGPLVFEPTAVLCSCCGMCSEDVRVRDGEDEAIERRACALIQFVVHHKFFLSCFWMR